MPRFIALVERIEKRGGWIEVDATDEWDAEERADAALDNGSKKIVWDDEADVLEWKCVGAKRKTKT